MNGYRILFLLLDGVADWPSVRLDGATPLEAARTPNLDAIAAGGANGIVYPLGPGRSPSSERAQWQYLGYESSSFPGRAVLEAEGAGLTIPCGVCAIYGALRSARPEGPHLRLQNWYREAEEPDCTELLRTLDGWTFEEIRFGVRPIERGDAVLILEGCRSAEVTDSDPFSTNEAILCVEALAEAADPNEAERTAVALNAFLCHAYDLLDSHPVNDRRRREQRVPLNVLVTKWAGRRVPVMPVRHHVGGSAVILASTPMYRGLASVLECEFVGVSSTNAEAEMTEKLEVALAALRNGCAFAYVHTKAPDEAAHLRDPMQKMAVIEAIDRALACVLKEADGLVVAVTSDHTTPTWGPYVHSGDAVPLAIRAPSARCDDVAKFGERAAARGSLGTLQGRDVLSTVVNLAGRGRFMGSRHGRWSTIATPEKLPRLTRRA